MTNNTTTDSSTDSTSCDTQLLSEELSEDLEALVGAKCRVPHSHDWGPVSWQNAMVFCAEPIKSEGELQVCHQVSSFEYPERPSSAGLFSRTVLFDRCGCCFAIRRIERWFHVRTFWTTSAISRMKTANSLTDMSSQCLRSENLKIQITGT